MSLVSDEQIKGKTSANKIIDSEELVKLKGFIVNKHYDIVDDKPIIHLYGRLENGLSFEVLTESKPHFYIKKNDELKAKSLLHIHVEESNFRTMEGIPVVKVLANIPKDVPKLRKFFEENDIACYEADILFTRKFCIDKDILTNIMIEGRPRKGIHTDLIFEDAKISPVKEKTSTTPTMLSFDIETDPKAKKIFSVSLYNPEISTVIVVKNEQIERTKLVGNVIIVEDEKELLKEFIKEVNKADPDVLIGWNLIDFDLKILLEKARDFDLPLTIGRTNNSIRLRLAESFFRDSSVDIQGRVVLDGIQVLKNSFIKLENYRLNTVAKKYLGESKLIEEYDRGETIERNYYEDPQKLIDYNLKDSELVYNIFIKAKIFELTLLRSQLTGLHLDEVKASIASFDSLYIRELHKKGFVAPTNRVVHDAEGLGGYVIDPKPGIYDEIIVLDFKSLYPSIMRTFNIDPLDYLGSVEELTTKGLILNDGKKIFSTSELSDKNKFIIAPNNAVFRNNPQGILPNLLANLWSERDKAKSSGDELTRYAIKILMNSMYGVLASRNSRFHIRSLSNAITFFAQKIIKMTQEEAEKEGFEVIYGDTDSIFVDVKTRDPKIANKIGFDLEKKLNVFFSEFIKNNYYRKSILEIEFEKQFVKLFIPSARGESKKGAKKRYAGKLIVDLETEDTKIDFTGLEFVRRDWTDVSKTFQLGLIERVFNDEPIESFIKKFVEDLKKGLFDSDLVYRKALRKDVSEYTKTTPPHVKAARLLAVDERKGIIRYVMTTKGPEPVTKQNHPIDYEHYIEKQIKPIANSILELKNTNFDDVIKGAKQEGLGQFF